MDVTGAIAAVFGGAGEIGLNIVVELLNRNVKGVTIFDLPSPTAEDKVAKLQSRYDNNRVIFIPCDITIQDQVDDGFKKMLASFGSVDIVINCAGVCEDTNWDSVIDINLSGLIRTSLAAIQNMGKHNGQKGGTLLNVSSVGGLTPTRYAPTYCATKCSVIGYTSSLKDNFSKTGVRVLTICPGLTNTALAVKAITEQNVDYVEYKKILAPVDRFLSQKPETVAKATVDLIEKGENGAMCVIENSEPPYLVNPPTLYDMPRSLL